MDRVTAIGKEYIDMHSTFRCLNRNVTPWLARCLGVVFIFLLASGCGSSSVSPSLVFHADDEVTIKLEDGQRLRVRSWVFSQASVLSKVAANINNYNQEAIQRVEARLASTLQDDMRRSLSTESR